MKYLLADFKIASEDENLMQAAREVLADMTGAAGFESFEDTPDGIKGYVQVSQFDKQTLDEVINSFPFECISISYQISEAEDKDWNAEWEENGFEPITIDNRCVIYDAKHNSTPPATSQDTLCVGIEARLAFGTGTHETTQMIVSNLLDMPLENKSVLDCGCGTGILGIVAAKLGAKHVTAYDIDDWSVDNTKHNAEINGVDCIDVLEGDSSVLSHVSGLFDVVVANINRCILIADMPAFTDMMHKGSVLLMSGFYSSDAPMIIDRAAELGLEEAYRKTNGDWCCLKFVYTQEE